MGKGILLLTVGIILVAGSTALYQADRTSRDTSEDQASYQAEIIAREIARSGYNAAVARAKQAQREYVDHHPATTSAAVIDTILQAINGGGFGEFTTTDSEAEPVPTGEGIAYQGGAFWTRAEKVGPEQYRISTHATFGEENAGIAAHNITVKHEAEVECIAGSACHSGCLKPRFLQSEAGWCSAVYVSVLGRGDEEPSDPLLLFASGRNRGSSVPLQNKPFIPRGALMNFFIGVDKDCSLRGGSTDDHSTFDRANFDHVNESFADWESGTLGEKGLEKIEGTPYALLDESPDYEANGRFRVAFEDQQKFSEPQYWDIKENGYGVGGAGNAYWDGSTYGGGGWADQGLDENGYRDLDDYYERPDFSDQVIELGLEEADGPGECQVDLTDDNSSDDPESDDDWDNDDKDKDKKKKIGICHVPPGNPSNEHTIRIPRKQWNRPGVGHSPGAHGGDYEGPCR